MIKVCQCWDDGVLNDIKVVELCRKYNAKATFNLNPGKHLATTRMTDGWQFRDTGYYPGKLAWSEVKSVYEGFEVASHGMNHLSAGVVDDKAFVADAVAARNVIEDLFQRECRGFAWPCGKYNEATVQMMHEAGFAYGRTTQYRESALRTRSKKFLPLLTRQTSISTTPVLGCLQRTKVKRADLKWLCITFWSASEFVRPRLCPSLRKRPLRFSKALA